MFEATQGSPPTSEGYRRHLRQGRVQKTHEGGPTAGSTFHGGLGGEDFRPGFLGNWILILLQKYAIDLSKQLGVKGVKTGVKVGKPLEESDLDKFSDEQLGQLYDLYSEAKKPIDKEKDPHLAS